jgi:hypothetical protein
MAWGPRPTCHVPSAPISVCEDGQPTREERATACGSTPLRSYQNRQSSLWHGGPGPRVILLGRRFLSTEKSNRHSRQYRASSRPLQETKKLNFSKPMQHLEAPRTWPNKAIKCRGHGSVSRGDRRGSQSDQGQTDSNCTSGRAETMNQSPNKLWPHLQARVLP